jgi:hypothetical protein
MHSPLLSAKSGQLRIGRPQRERRSAAARIRRWICGLAISGAAVIGTSAAHAQTHTVSLGMLPGHEWINYAAPFWRDSQLDLHPRTYFLDRRNFNETRDRAWAGGGWIGWQSGYAHDVFQVGATLYTSQPLFAPPDEGGTLLLTEDQESITTFGQAWIAVRFAEQRLTFWRQLVDTPLINPRDNRMIPITFEGITLKGAPPMQTHLSYWVGYLWDFKPRDVAYFESMSSGLGVEEDFGAIFGLVRLEPMNGWHFAAMDYFIHDTINSGYGEARYDFPKIENGPAWTFAINDMFQSNVGDDLITGDPFFTHQASARLGAAYNSWTLFLAGSTTGTGADIRSPFGSKPNYTDMQQVSFDRAGEDAVVVGAAYDFTKLGLPGVTAGASLGHGVDAINPFTGSGLPDRTEYDLFLQYRPSMGPLQGLRLQAKYAKVLGDGFGPRGAQPEFRLIADYSVLLKK